MIFYVDPDNGNDTRDGLSFATSWKTITSGVTAAKITPGDTIRVKKSPAPLRIQTSAGVDVDATWTDNSNAITLSAAATANISLSNSAWTASTNVTASTTTTRKIGSTAASLAVAAGFTTGKIAYTTCSTANLSAYTKVSFWISTSIAVSGLELRLCSDAAGNTAVNTLVIPTTSAGGLTPVTIDNLGALGASIVTVALYATSDPGTVTITMNNVLACNRLSLSSLISKSSTDLSWDWWCIQSINGTAVVLDMGPGSSVTVTSGTYYGTTETVATYAREPYATSTSLTSPEAGLVNAMITISGGWDSTNMSSQSGITFFQASGGIDVFTMKSFMKVEKFFICRGSDGFDVTASYSFIEDVGGCGFDQYFVNMSGATGLYIKFKQINQVFISGIIGTSVVNWMIVEGDTIKTCGTAGINLGGGRYSIKVPEIHTGGTGLLISGVNDLDFYCETFKRCATAISLTNAHNCVMRGDMVFASTVTIRAITMTRASATFKKIDTSAMSVAPLSLTNGSKCFINRMVPNGTSVCTMSNDYSSCEVVIKNFNNTSTDSRKYTIAADNIEWRTDTVTRHSGTGVSWRCNPHTNRFATFPAKLYTDIIPVEAGRSYTASVFVYRTDANSMCRLVMEKYQLKGMSTEYSDITSGSLNVWELLTISFTATQTGTIRLCFQAYGAATSVYFDDFIISRT